MKVEQVERLIRLATVMAAKLPETEQNEMLVSDLSKVVADIRSPIFQRGNQNEGDQNV